MHYTLLALNATSFAVRVKHADGVQASCFKQRARAGAPAAAGYEARGSRGRARGARRPRSTLVEGAGTRSESCPARARGLRARRTLRERPVLCTAHRCTGSPPPVRRSSGTLLARRIFICDRGGAKARHSQGRGQLLARTQHDRAVRAVLVVRRRLGARETRSSKDSGRVVRLCAPGLTPAVHVSGSRRFALPSARAVQAERANQPRARLAPPYSLLEPHQQWAQGSKNTPTRFVASSALAGLGTRAMPAARSRS